MVSAHLERRDCLSAGLSIRPSPVRSSAGIPPCNCCFSLMFLWRRMAGWPGTVALNCLGPDPGGCFCCAYCVVLAGLCASGDQHEFLSSRVMWQCSSTFFCMVVVVPMSACQCCLSIEMRMRCILCWQGLWDTAVCPMICFAWFLKGQVGL